MVADHWFRHIKNVLEVMDITSVTPVGSQSDPIGGSEPKSGARYYLYTIYILSIYYTVLGLSLTCSSSERYMYL